MNNPRFTFVPVLGHEIHVTEWGQRGNPPLVMWHGLARTGRDFDELAAALSESYFVICPDTIGRGLSSWSRNPTTDYHVGHYAEIALGLMDHYRMDTAAWLGTSMGGAIGMYLAAGASSDRISCLVLNDIGPEVPNDAIARIVQYVSDPPVFMSFYEADKWFCETYAPFGPASRDFCDRMTRSSLRRTSKGGLALHYDPKIVQQLSPAPVPTPQMIAASWEGYDRIQVPTHVVRGKTSDVLSAETFERMQQQGPKAGGTIYEDCGHAPTLSRPRDIDFITQVLAELQAG